MDFKKRKHDSIGKALYKFIWGQEVELGDCVFYTILSEILLALLWLFTFERIGISVEFSLIVWVVIVFLIWREYIKTRPGKKREQDGRSNT
ncbi:MAG: hypothetical protein JEZ04_19070 [Spirochaetales bacterium]|nr:hypothetical protein [Spirochaetales bacterium]